jgi:hypothetical protein
MNTCQVQDCGIEIRDRDIVCSKHWYKVHPSIRKAINKELDKGERETTPLLVLKMKAIRSVNERIANAEWQSRQQRAE